MDVFEKSLAAGKNKHVMCVCAFSQVFCSYMKKLFHMYVCVCAAAGKCMYLSGVLPRPMSADDDSKLLQLGIGFTNIVERTTRGSANLTRKEIEDGKRINKMRKCKNA